MSDSRALVLRGQRISEDVNGHICLDDIWMVARARATRAPKFWRMTHLAKTLIQTLQQKVTTANFKSKTPYVPVIYARRGRGNEGTFAHPILAAAYAGYLSANLEIEVREIWLRYRKGDPTLADEILQRATAEENRWVGARAVARSQRIAFTDVLKKHGVEGKGYMRCTEAVYMRLLGAKSFQIRLARNLPAKSNLRDNMDIAELSFVMAAEALSAERIREEHRLGNEECEEATGRSAQAIRTAIDADRRDRQRKMI